jgi:hypothetical protein
MVELQLTRIIWIVDIVQQEGQVDRRFRSEGGFRDLEIEAVLQGLA